MESEEETMYSANFEYYQPKTLNQALALLKKHGQNAKILAGGHSLLPVMKLRQAQPAVLVDIGRLKPLSGIKATKTTIRIGALTTHAELADSELLKTNCPIISETASQIGDTQVRNRGTIGGSLAHADPAADLPTVMIALGAKLVANGAGGKKREIAAEAFFVDLFTTALKPGEVLTEIRVPIMAAGTGGAYLKHRHPASSYAVVGVAAIVGIKNGACSHASLVVGGATTNPVRAVAAEKELNGKSLDDGTISAAAAKVAEAIENPLGDLYASGEYRTHLATLLAGRALRMAVERAS
jgi:carbon-monoxide dehydrogenase medium subunit